MHCHFCSPSSGQLRVQGVVTALPCWRQLPKNGAAPISGTRHYSASRTVSICSPIQPGLPSQGLQGAVAKPIYAAGQSSTVLSLP